MDGEKEDVEEGAEQEGDDAVPRKERKLKAQEVDIFDFNELKEFYEMQVEARTKELAPVSQVSRRELQPR